MTTVPAAVSAPTIRSATRATFFAFTAIGFCFASWASRLPQVRDGLGLDPASLGLVLLAIAAGSVLSMPTSGFVVARFGSQRTVAAMSVLMTVALTTVAIGFLFGVAPVVAGLFLLGIANGSWDVAMNVQGATVERLVRRSIMARFHAAFSVGTVLGALVGAGLVALHVPVTAHLIGVAVLIAATVPVSVRAFVPDHTGDGTDDDDSTAPSVQESKRRTLLAWREPRTLLVGLFVLAFAFAEGTGNDWIAIALIDDYRLPAAIGTLGFAVFLAAMTVGRWFGPGLLDRYGRVVVLRALCGVAVAGLAAFVFGGHPLLAFAGLVLWGLGASLGFPVGMSAGADQPSMAAARVSVIASIGYCAFLAGPPLIGFLGAQITVLKALTAAAVLLGLALLIAGNLRPAPTQR